MDESPDINSEPAPEDPRGLRDLWYSQTGIKFRRILGKIFYRIFRLGGEITAVCLGLGIAVGWYATSVLDRQSTDLTVLRPNLKIWFASAFEGRGAEFGRLDVAWLPTQNQFVLTMEDVEVSDSDNLVLESFDLIQATLAVDPTNFKRPELINATVTGGSLSYVEDKNGKITVGLGLPDTVGRVGPVYRNDVERKTTSNIPLESIENIQVYNANVYVRNAISDIDLKASVDQLNASFSGENGIVMSAEGTVEQTQSPAAFTLNSIVETELSRVRLRLNIERARLDEIGPKSGRFWEFSGLEAPVDLMANIDFSRKTGLASAEVDLSVSNGFLKTLRTNPIRSIPFDSLNAKATLEPGNDTMVVQKLDLSSPKLSFKGTGALTQLGNLNDGDINSSPVFDLQFEDLVADMTPTFAKPIRVKALELSGQADVDSRTLRLRQGAVSLFDSRHEFSGLLVLSETNEPVRLEFKSEMSGEMRPQEFLSLWPQNAATGARRWIDRSIIDARLHQLETNLNFGPDFFEDPKLTENRVQVRYATRDARVQYMEFMPPAVDVVGSGAIIGNQLIMNLESGRVSKVELTGGSIEIPRLLPKGGDLIINANGTGGARDLLVIANHKPFEFATRYGVDPMNLDGSGQVQLTVTRPLLEHFSRERITYQINGDFINGKAPFSFGKFDIKNGNINLDANRERMVMSGPVDIGPWRADMRWQETFGDNPPPTQYSASGPIDADILDKIGVPSRGWFDGRADLKVDALGRGMNVSDASITVDLTNSALSVERIWMKPEGEAASLAGQITNDPGIGFVVNEARLEGEGISVDGTVSLAQDFQLRSLDLNDVKISGLVDGSMQLRPDREQSRLEAIIDGTFLDVSAWTQDMFQTRRSGLDVPILLTGQIATLVLDPDYTVRDATLLFSHTGDFIDSARLRALAGEDFDEDLSLELLTADDKSRTLQMFVPDASKAVGAFMGLDNTTGGELRVNANLPPAGAEGVYNGEAQMRDFRLNEAPALVQLLSLASLTGLADTLSGGSMQFERFTIPFTMRGDEIAIRDARLYGPALGMTGDGDIDLGLRVLDFDGTIVPSYSANSILGDIPVLGDIFVGEKDGGLFALTYTVSGPFEKTQVAINPLSALTPGFLRKIFKPNRKDVSDELKEKIKDVAPPVQQDP